MTAPDLSLPTLIAWLREWAEARRKTLDICTLPQEADVAEALGADVARFEATAAALERLIQLEGENGD